jgi:hypothetical protein
MGDADEAQLFGGRGEADFFGEFSGGCLLQHLAERLSVDHGFVDLNIHILWLLLSSRPGLCHDAPIVARSLAQQSDMLINDDRLSRRSRRELSDVLYSLRTMGVTA